MGSPEEQSRPPKAKLDLTAAALNAAFAWKLSMHAVGSGIGVTLIDSGTNASDVNVASPNLLGIALVLGLYIHRSSSASALKSKYKIRIINLSLGWLVYDCVSIIGES